MELDGPTSLEAHRSHTCVSQLAHRSMRQLLGGTTCYSAGPIDAIMAFILRDGHFWGQSPSIWWPEDRAWCVATDIDLFDTYVGGSEECIEAVLNNPDLEALLTTLDARLDLGGDTINAKDVSGGCG